MFGTAYRSRQGNGLAVGRMQIRAHEKQNLFGTFILTLLCRFDTWRAFKLRGRVMRRRMSAFEIYLRTGRRLPDQPELVETKFNPWHDPEDGRFTFAGQGRHFGGGHVRSDDILVGRQRVSSRPQIRATTAQAPARSVSKPAPQRPNQDSATFLQIPTEALERIRREMTTTRNVPAPNDLVQRFKRHMIPKENDRNDVYPDSRGIPTVGIGHRVVPADKLKLGDRISDARKEVLWRQDSSKALQAAQQQTKAAGISDTDFLIALADVNFQLGTDWYKEHKKTWSLMVNGDYEAAAREVQDSDWYDQTPERVQAFQRALQTLRRK
jgi:GH24 family phage-related lysozyme (muramidase)